MRTALRLIIAMLLLGAVLLIPALWSAYQTWYWADLYTVRSAFARMSDVHILEEHYDTDLTVEDIYMTIEIDGIGRMELGPLSPESFVTDQQLWIIRIGDCHLINAWQTRSTVREVIDRYRIIYQRVRPTTLCDLVPPDQGNVSDSK